MHLIKPHIKTIIEYINKKTVVKKEKLIQPLSLSPLPQSWEGYSACGVGGQKVGLGQERGSRRWGEDPAMSDPHCAQPQ